MALRSQIGPQTSGLLFNQPGVRGILQIYLRHAASQRLTSLRESDRIRVEVEAIERVFPGARENLEVGVCKHWGEDEWVRGGWAHPTEAQLPHIKGAEGRVHFAGEHTSVTFSWMQGALESGMRAAREVHEAPHPN
jgi:monoamine oxidase